LKHILQERIEYLDGNSDMKRVLLIQCNTLSRDKQSCQSLPVLTGWKDISLVLTYCLEKQIWSKTR